MLSLTILNSHQFNKLLNLNAKIVPGYATSHDSPVKHPEKIEQLLLAVKSCTSHHTNVPESTNYLCVNDTKC